MQIEEVGEVWEVTTSGLPALGNEPVCLKHPFFFGAKIRQKATLPKFSG
jgi:hypothetical protein